MGTGDGRQPSPALTVALCAVLCLVWGSTWLVIREGLDDLPPFTALAARFLVAFAAFALVAHPLHRLEGGERPGRGLTLTMGLVLHAFSYAVIYQAEQTVPSGLTAVLWGVYPILMAVAGHCLLPGERLRPGAALGFVTGFAGVVLLFVADLRAISSSAVLGGALLLASPLATAIGTVHIKRSGSATSSVLLCRDSLGVAAVVTAVLALLFERDAEATWSGRALFSVLYLGIVGTCVTFSVYFWLLRFAAASRLSLIAYVTPAVALVLGWLVRGEPVGPTTLVGAALIVVGVALAGRR